MPGLTEELVYEETIYQLELTDNVIGGTNGIANRQAKQLANRTKWLKDKIDSILSSTFEAPKAIKLSNAMKISLGGILSGFANFDGSANITINAAIADGALSIAKTNGLQTALDAKMGSVPDASIIAKGIIQLATSAEVQAGTNSDKAVTAAAILSCFANNKASNGYTKLPNGLMLQWFTATGSSGTYSFPMTFPNACLGVFMSNGYGNINAFSNVTSFTASAATTYCNASVLMRFFAIGY